MSHWLMIFLKGLTIVVLLLVAYLFIGWPHTYENKIYGLTWSVPYANYLGVDPYRGLEAALDDLKVRFFRLPMYWTEVEPQLGNFVWDSIDRQLGLIQRRGGKVILSVGAKQPRWPECWLPAWVKKQTATERHAAQLTYVEQVVKRYAKHPALSAWQVENEPTFFSSFGDCQFYDPNIAAEEVRLVRELDQNKHQIITTASGEMSTWLFQPAGIDALGVSVYRVVANSLFDRWSYWFLPAWYYQRKASLVSLVSVPVFVSEFQMEPWVKDSLLDMSPEQQFKTFDLEQMRRNASYAKQIDVPSIYFWGAEWWYWMKEKKGHPEFWEEAKQVFKQK